MPPCEPEKLQFPRPAEREGSTPYFVSVLNAVSSYDFDKPKGCLSVCLSPVLLPIVFVLLRVSKE